MSDYFEVTECRCCGGSRLHQFLDLTDQPLANSYHTPGEVLKKFPLKANVCLDCWHTQLSVVVNPSLMFEHYLYVSGTAQTMRDYMDYFAELTLDLTGRSAASDGTSVLDIACNDGTQLDSYLRLNPAILTTGVDPAKNLVPLARANGHNVICDYWTDEVASQFKTFDIITAQNVFAHTHDALGFLNSCKKVMDERSLLFIQTSQAQMFENNEFDTMYHEHLSFFNTLSMEHLVNRAGMTLERVEKTSIHGTSYVFIISLYGNVNSRGHNIGTIISREARTGLYDLKMYEQFAENAHRVVTDLREAVDKFSSEGRFVVGYGAAAKGMTLLNFGNIPLDYIIDDNPLKVGLLTPGTDIPIYSGQALLEPADGIAYIPLAWNFATEIKGKIKATRPNRNDIFVKYFPELVIETE